jgi:hypothetical protein
MYIPLSRTTSLHRLSMIRLDYLSIFVLRDVFGDPKLYLLRYHNVSGELFLVQFVNSDHTLPHLVRQRTNYPRQHN